MTIKEYDMALDHHLLTESLNYLRLVAEHGSKLLPDQELREVIAKLDAWRNDLEKNMVITS